jgi:hypothetical protein
MFSAPLINTTPFIDDFEASFHVASPRFIIFQKVKGFAA